MATTNKALTARDKAHVRKTARELHAAYEMGEDDSTSETVMLSSGYADVEIYPGEEKFAYVVRHGRTTRVSMSGPTALGWPRKAGRKTATRKKVSSKKTANPSKKRAGLDAFTRAYIDAALFSSNDENDDPLDRNYSASDLSGPTLMQMKRDAAKFQRENASDLDAGSSSQGGHDFWLTRNRHGAGFWYGDWPKAQAQRLTDAAHRFGEVDLYVSDTGKIRSFSEKKRSGVKRSAGRKTASRRKVSSKRVANPAKHRRAPKRKAARKPRRRAKR